MEAFKTEVLNVVAELTAKVEELSAKVNGNDESSSEQFSAVKLEEMFTKFADQLRPATDVPAPEPKKETAPNKVESVVDTLTNMRKN
jgi:hypothetical protein